MTTTSKNPVYAGYGPIYGLPYGFTVYGGVQASQYYDALALGSARISAISGPFRWMSPTPNQRCRIRIPPAGALAHPLQQRFRHHRYPFSIAGYRYNSKGSTPCRTRWIPIPVMTTEETPDAAPQPRGEATVDQSLGEGVWFLTLSWSKRTTGIQAGG